MIKKVFAAVLCMLMIASFIPFTVSAADTAAFKICVAAQDSKSITITLDCANNAGFCAFDASIKYNNLKLSLEDCQFASGFAAFKQYVDSQSGMTIFNANSDVNPVRISIATTVPFKAINGDGAIIKIRFSKIEDANVSESDIVLNIENCQNENFEDIRTSVAYDLTTGSSSSANNLIIESGKLPEEKAAIIDGSKTTTAAEKKNNGKTEKAGTDAVQQTSQDADAAAEPAVSDEQKTDAPVKADKGLSNSKKTVIIIIITVALIVGLGALVLILNKNKKSA